MQKVERITNRIRTVETGLILMMVGGIAYGDWLAGPEVSLGYLYLVPLSFSVLIHGLAWTALLTLACVSLRQWLGPLEHSGWEFFIRDWVLVTVALLAVTMLQRLGREQRAFFETARRQRDELRREVELAAEIQNHLLKSNASHEKLEFTARTVPVKAVGGDYHDFVELEDGRFAVIIADVAGKGLSAALLMPALQISLRALAADPQRTEKRVMERLNSALCETTPTALYATLFYGVLDPGSGTLRYVNAGHLPGLILRAQSGKREWLEASAPPVGLLEEIELETRETRLLPGDLMLLYTDGVVEAESPAGEPFERERLARVALDNRHLPAAEIVEAVRRAVDEFADGQDPRDDLTAIAIRMPEAGTGSLGEHFASPGPSSGSSLSPD